LEKPAVRSMGRMFDVGVALCFSEKQASIHKASFWSRLAPIVALALVGNLNAGTDLFHWSSGG
jgi:hypothetical protein